MTNPDTRHGDESSEGPDAAPTRGKHTGLAPGPVERIHPDAASVPSWVREQHLLRYEWASRFAAGQRVLDIACGTGYGTAMLHRAGARSALGVDIDDASIRGAVREHATDGLSFAQGDATSVQQPDSSFDLIVSFETIEHLPQDRAYLSEMRRLIADGGRFLCSSPNRSVMNPGRTIHDGSFNPHHVREYDLDEFRTLLSEYFTQVELYGQSEYTEPYVASLSSLARLSRMAGVRVHQVRKLLTSVVDRDNDRHCVRPLRTGRPPEFFVALCQR